jgi:hypothetical protein
MIRNRVHVVMKADLAHYPPCHTPYSGFVLRGRNRQRLAELAPGLLNLSPALASAEVQA